MPPISLLVIWGIAFLFVACVLGYDAYSDYRKARQIKKDKKKSRADFAADLKRASAEVKTSTSRASASTSRRRRAAAIAGHPGHSGTSDAMVTAAAISTFDNVSSSGGDGGGGGGFSGGCDG
jgi:hypothetical protein